MLVVLLNVRLMNLTTGLPRLILISSLSIVSLYLWLFVLSTYYLIVRYQNRLRKQLVSVMQFSACEKWKLLAMSGLYLALYLFFLSSRIGLVTALYFFSFGGAALLALIKVIFFRKILKKYEESGGKKSL